MRLRPAVPALLLALVSPLAAQAPARNLGAKIDFSYVQAAGNTRLTTIRIGEELTYHPAPWKFTQTFVLLNSRSAGVETADNLRFGGRADYELTPRFRLYALGLFERDNFAGLDRRLTEQAGVSYGVVATPRDTLDTEAGLGLTQERPDSGASRSFASSRLAARYRHSFREATYFEGKGELLNNLEVGADSRINADLALVAPLSRRIGLRLGYTLRFDNQPEPGTKKTDTVASAGLQITL